MFPRNSQAESRDVETPCMSPTLSQMEVGKEYGKKPVDLLLTVIIILIIVLMVIFVASGVILLY